MYLTAYVWVNILIKEPYKYSLKFHNKSSKFICTKWITAFVRRISNLIGLPLLSEHRFNFKPYYAFFHQSLSASVGAEFNKTSLVRIQKYIALYLRPISGYVRRRLRMSFLLLFVFVSWISVILCPTRAQGKFEIFPLYLLCICFLQILP